MLELVREGWIKIKTKIMDKFGQTCKDVEYRTTIDLLDNLVPAVLDIYVVLFRSGSFDEYVEYGHLLCAGNEKTIIKHP